MNNKFLREKFEETPTFLSKVFRSCANKIVQNLFETLSVATRYCRDHVGFLVEVSVQKLSKLGLCCQKVSKFGNFGFSVVKFV